MTKPREKNSHYERDEERFCTGVTRSLPELAPSRAEPFRKAPSTPPPTAGLGDAPPRGPRPRSVPPTTTARTTKRSITIPPVAPSRLGRMTSDRGLYASSEAIVRALGLSSGRLGLVVELPYEQLGSAIQRAAEALGLLVDPHPFDRERLADEPFVERLVASVRDAQGVVYLAGPLGISPALRATLFGGGAARRDALVLGVDERIALHDLASQSDELGGIAARLEARCRKGRVLDVEAIGGTDLQIGVGPSASWHHDLGRLDGPGLLVLPAGRSIFCPSNVTGTLTPDGGVLLPGDETRVPATKVRLRFDQGRLVGAEGPNAERILDAARAVPCGTMVGQVVFGTNPAVITSIGHEGQDLTMPGLHIVLGDSRPEHTGSALCAATSLTLAVRRPDVRLDGEPLLVRGKFARTLLFD